MPKMPGKRFGPPVVKKLGKHRRTIGPAYLRFIL